MRPNSSTHRTASLLLAALIPFAGTAACYRYVPAPARVAEGERVRLEFTTEGAERLAGRLGNGVQRIEADVLRDAADSISVRLRSVDAEIGSAMTIVGDVELAIPRDALASVGVRRLDRPVTVIATVAGIGTLIAITQGIRGGGSGGGDGNQPPPPIQPSRAP